MRSKSSNTSLPAKLPAPSPEALTLVNQVENSLNNLEEFLNILIKKRVHLGEYNTDSRDILALCQALRATVVQVRDINRRL